MNLWAGGNTVVPGILLIRQLGYTVTIGENKDWLTAEKDGNSFGAEDPIMVLGLIKLFEMKGENWQASDEEIEEVLKEIT